MTIETEIRELTPEEIEMSGTIQRNAAATRAEEARRGALKADAETRQRTYAEAYAAMIASSDRSTDDEEAEEQT